MISSGKATGDSTSPAYTAAEYSALTGAILTNTAIQDVREGDNVRLVNLDVSKLYTSYGAGNVKDTIGGTSNAGGDGLTLFIQDTSVGTSVSAKGYKAITNNGTTTSGTTTVTSSSHRGVRLINGQKVPSIGMTIASPNPVYIQGDFNTGSGSTVPSNVGSSYGGSTDPNPYVSGYTKAVAVIVADAVNILSNNWTDANAIISQSTSTAPSATSTTINAAIVAGNVPTTSSSYSGGIENFPRFHEDWSGDYFTLYGSFALLFDSAQGTGTWSNALYSPPDRHWYFDTLLQNSNPPGFPVAYTYDRGDWQTK